jgi:hypothetical protein
LRLLYLNYIIKTNDKKTAIIAIKTLSSIGLNLSASINTKAKIIPYTPKIITPGINEEIKKAALPINDLFPCFFIIFNPAIVAIGSEISKENILKKRKF